MSGNEQNQPETACLHAIVDGSVQGVGFRMFAQQQAESMGLTGWVRNKFDGRVEVMAEGPRNKLEQLAEKLRLGPRSAYVTEMQTEWLPANKEFTRFEVRRTE